MSTAERTTRSVAELARSVQMEGCDVVTIRDGLIVDNRAFTKGAEPARQLGALPPQRSARERAMLGALNLTTRLSRIFRR